MFYHSLNAKEEEHTADSYFIVKRNFQNGKFPAQVSFYFEKAAIPLYQERRGGIDFNPDRVFQEYLSNDHAKIERSFFSAMEAVQKHGSGTFPNEATPSTHFTVILCKIERAVQAFYSARDRFRSMTLLLHIENTLTKVSQERVAFLILHEFYHLFELISHNQQEMLRQLRGYGEEMVAEVTEDREKIQSHAEILEKVIVRQSSDFFKDGKLDYILDLFYNDDTGLFRNYIADASLCAVAIDLHHEAFVQGAIAEDRHGLSRLVRDFNKLKKIREGINSSNIVDKGPYLATVRVLMYMTCFEFMPFSGIAAYAIPHSKQWGLDHPYRYIDGQKDAESNYVDLIEIISTYCDDEVKNPFLKFYDAFLDAVAALAVRYDPVDPQLKKTVHSASSISEAIHANHLLYMGLSELIEGLKKEARSGFKLKSVA